MVWGTFGWSEPEEKKSVDNSEADYPECDYDKDLTPLYEAIEERAWIAVNQFLHSGYWPESLFEDPMTPEEQARTWVTRYETRPDGTKKVRWSQLPIHAAVIFGAPSVVIQQLVEAFPQSVRCTDDHRMLPLHLAFRHGSDDSVLALFLEEFPEAVNVRGYKGRLPVECAQKGPNPERGAIIQTILQKNQSAWERKKSAVQLKELYVVKEALKIKSQKVSHLETAIREIKSREHKTRKELATTMTELKAAKAKKKEIEERDGEQDETEKQAINELVEKLARLEKATRDLVEKENKTKTQLKKTLAELESTKKKKPTDTQSEQFAKLDRVASKEKNMLERGEIKDKPASNDPAIEVVAKDNKTPALTESASREAEKEKLRKVEESNRALEQKIASLEASLKKFDDQASKAQEEFEAISVVEQESKLTDAQTEHMKALEIEMATLKDKSDKTKEELDEALRKLDEFKEQQDEKTKAILKGKTEAAENRKKLDKKIALLELALKQFEEKSSLAKEEMKKIKDTMSSEAELKLTPSQTKHLAALEAAMKKLDKNVKKTKKELDSALAERETIEKNADENANLEANKLISFEQTNKELEKKIALLEGTMKQFEDKAAKTKQEMDSAMSDLKNSSDSSTVKSGDEKLSKKQEKHMAMLEASMKKLEEQANKTKKELDTALEELKVLKSTDKSAMNEAVNSKSESKALKALAKKVQALQSAMVGFEVKETRTMQDLEKTMKDLEKVSNKRFEVLTASKEHSQDLASDPQFNKEVSKLDQKATKEEKKLAELEGVVKDLMAKSGSTKGELERTQKLLEDIKGKYEKDGPLTKEEKVEHKHDKKIIKELTKKVSTLQSAIIGFEVKETRTMKELEHTMKQLEELTSKRFEVLENAAAKKEKETERLTAQGALAEEKVAALQTAMKELEQNAACTKEELDKTKQELETIKSGGVKGGQGGNKEEIKELNDKILTLQKTVTGFEEKETKTMQELEHTMKQLEELTAKRFEVLQRVAGREIEAAKAAEASKYEEKAAQEEKKVAALEVAMRELESKSYNQKLELERTMKALEQIEQNQSSPKQPEGTGISKEEKRVMRELVSKVADIQEAVMAYDEKELKTNQELDKTRAELESTRKEVKELRAKYGENKALATTVTDSEPVQISTKDSKSQVETVDMSEEDAQSQAASEAAKRVTEDTLSSLEEAISRLVHRLDEEETEQAAQESAAPTDPVMDKQEAPVVDKATTLPQAVVSQTEKSDSPPAVESQKEVSESPAEKAMPTSSTEPTAQELKPATPSDPAEAIVKAETETKTKTKKRGSLFSFFGKKKSKAKSKKGPSSIGASKTSVEKKVETQFKSPLPPVISKATAEQRKKIEATHGADIAAVLTDEQILAILAKMNSASPAKEVVEVETVTSAAESTHDASVKSSGRDTASVKSSVRDASSVKSAVKDASSVKSSKSATKEEVKAPSVSFPAMPSGKVAPMTTDGTSAPNGSPSPKAGTEVLVTARTYDDGFEINF